MRPEHEDLIEAMQEAEKAFQKELNDRGVDPAFFDLELRGWLLDAYDVEPLGKKIVFEADHKSSLNLSNEREEER